MHLIVGLGNPDPKYQNTRHNAGWLLIDALAEKAGATWENAKRLNAFLARSGDTIYLKPLTYMNRSGESVRSALDYYKLLPRTLGIFATRGADLTQVLTLVHDELDLPLGAWKISADSRSAGHRGVQSVIDQLKTKNFRRIRIGIRTDEARQMPADAFVLRPFSAEEKPALDTQLKAIAADAALWR